MVSASLDSILQKHGWVTMDKKQKITACLTKK